MAVEARVAKLKSKTEILALLLILSGIMTLKLTQTSVRAGIFDSNAVLQFSSFERTACFGASPLLQWLLYASCYLLSYFRCNLQL